MGLIKDIYSAAFYNQFADTLQQVLPYFSKPKFLEQALGDGFHNMEWKERMKHTTRVVHHFMPSDFSEAAKLIEAIISRLKENGAGEDGLVYIFFPDYIETYGLDDFESSATAFAIITQFVSCEFAVRPFLLKYEGRMIEQMVAWSGHSSSKVRRLASEGSRPRLPWAMAIPSLKRNPEPILPILENLKNDSSESVRRSVANNLNDIAKDHPEVVISIAAKWRGQTKETDAIIKHGCRTLLKQGHTEILKHYGLDSEGLVLNDFSIETPVVKVGDNLEFSFSISNLNESSKTIRLEYGLYYKKSKGHLAKKVFKISEKTYAPNAVERVSRRQSFKIITTRVFHPGKHELTIIVNGDEREALSFELEL